MPITVIKLKDIFVSWIIPHTQKIISTIVDTGGKNIIKKYIANTMMKESQKGIGKIQSGKKVASAPSQYIILFNIIVHSLTNKVKNNKI